MHLVFDTSTPQTTVALAQKEVLLGRFLKESASHGPVLLPAIERLLQEHEATPSDLTMVGCGIGPGTFTGIRIGLATAKAFAWGLGIPLVGFSCLEVLAHQGAQRDPLLALQDARRGEVYYALYQGGVLTRGPGISTPEALPAIVSPELRPYLTGSALAPYGALLSDLYGREALAQVNHCIPEALVAVAQKRLASPGFVSMDLVEPLYIRPSDAEKNL